jgi:hypothetical protein
MKDNLEAVKRRIKKILALSKSPNDVCNAGDLTSDL